MLISLHGFNPPRGCTGARKDARASLSGVSCTRAHEAPALVFLPARACSVHLTPETVRTAFQPASDSLCPPSRYILTECQSQVVLSGNLRPLRWRSAGGVMFRRVLWRCTSSDRRCSARTCCRGDLGSFDIPPGALQSISKKRNGDVKCFLLHLVSVSRFGLI